MWACAMNEFTCAKCKETFHKGWSDEDAEKEFVNAPWNIPGDSQGLVCDDCFIEFQKWFATLTPEEHRKFRNE